MNTFILFPNAFPIGGSSTQRVLHLAMAISQNDINTEVLIYRGTEIQQNIINSNISGSYKGINYKYTSANTIWPHSTICKVSNYNIGLYNLLKYLYRKLQSDSIAILYADYSIITNYIIKIVTFLKGAKYVYLVDEFPWCIIHSNKFSNIYKKLYLNIYYKSFHGIVSMTETLKTYYSRISSKSCLHFHLPMTVDINRFMHDEDTFPFNFEYIAYCGGESPDYNKDGIDYLIDSFKLITKKFPEIKLVIIGKVTEKRVLQAKELNISDSVVFTQHVDSGKIPQLLKHAKLLLLSRPDNIQAQGGFPTKLGEYLACGIPVVVTATGEITNYLTDGVNAYISKPNDSVSFAKKMDEALSNYDKAKLIGQNGFNTALHVFDYLNYSSSINAFLKSLF